MFSGRVEACPCPEFRNKFPNLYLESMQFNNPDGKWQKEMPYMIINLEYDRDIYLGKDTIVAYAWEEDKTCEYLEVNEVIESTEFRNWTPRKGKSIIDSDLVFFSSSGDRALLCGAEASGDITGDKGKV